MLRDGGVVEVIDDVVWRLADVLNRTMSRDLDPVVNEWNLRQVSKFTRQNSAVALAFRPPYSMSELYSRHYGGSLAGG